MCIFMLTFTSFVFCSTQLILNSKLITYYSDNIVSNKFLTNYSYDSKGNKIFEKNWSGVDSLMDPMSQVQFSYNDNKLSEELYLKLSDTLSLVKYFYINNKVSSIKYLSKNNQLLYSDSTIYNQLGYKTKTIRLSSANFPIFYHTYEYNSYDKIITDSLFENLAGFFSPTNAVLFKYNPDSSVASESEWRVRSGVWYCISTKLMEYKASKLVSVAKYERNAINSKLIDSLTYSYDLNNIQITEDKYDDTKSLLYHVDYIWKDNNPTQFAQRYLIKHNSILFYNQSSGGEIMITNIRNPSKLSIFDTKGKRVYDQSINNRSTLPLKGIVQSGVYLAVLTVNGVYKQRLSFNHVN